MKLLFAIMLSSLQLNPPPYKWVCNNVSQSVPDNGISHFKPDAFRERVVSCAVPRLPENVTAEGSIKFDVFVDEKGNVQCARFATQSLVFRRAALEAVMKWKFEPLVEYGKAVPYTGVLNLFLSRDSENAGRECPKEKRRD